MSEVELAYIFLKVLNRLVILLREVVLNVVLILILVFLLSVNLLIPTVILFLLLWAWHILSFLIVATILVVALFIEIVPAWIVEVSLLQNVEVVLIVFSLKLLDLLTLKLVPLCGLVIDAFLPSTFVLAFRLLDILAWLNHMMSSSENFY